MQEERTIRARGLKITFECATAQKTKPERTKTCVLVFLLSLAVCLSCLCVCVCPPRGQIAEATTTAAAAEAAINNNNTTKKKKDNQKKCQKLKTHTHPRALCPLARGLVVVVPLFLSFCSFACLFLEGVQFYLRVVCLFVLLFATTAEKGVENWVPSGCSTVCLVPVGASLSLSLFLSLTLFLRSYTLTRVGHGVVAAAGM